MTKIIVVGAGPGGTAAATRAAHLGAQVTLIEKGHLGGNCVNHNCIPLTGMLASVALLDRVRRASEMGVQVAGEPSIDLAQARDRVQGIVAELREGIAGLMESFGVEVVHGQAVLASPNTVVVGDDEISGDALILATGARPGDPPLDLPGLLTPNQALALDEPPARLLIWGDGAVELEFAQYFALLGSQVTLLAPGHGVLPDEDYEVGQRLQAILAEAGIQVLTNAQLVSAAEADGAVEVQISRRKEGQSLHVDRVLWAGYEPAIAGLGLEALGVEMEAGAVKVDEACRTNLAGVYAVGDMTGDPMYSYVATTQGLIAAENALGGQRRLDLRAMPRCIYTLPEVACVGLSEDEAEDRGLDFEVVNISQETSVRAMTLGQAVGGVKVVFDRKFGKLLGVHIVGARATELIAEAALAIQLEALAEDFAWALRGHPTLSESMVEAGRAYFGQALYIPKW